ncbi:polysaccharide biosynthesis/export family protein [Mucilaginibacter sp. UR6-11]|uniref:polysaccharide biosynthesis/export family protein n=1 Tax=Mucilaginibacter sp. UR6-11 TaxID=1435644 RepID=UPI001E46A4C6|nr:polysaccharide biosynthesis/export family protein [Mucilaginibacter sp. UR6-11]MCC8426381.1 polysaccharide biosynthesis/export family protein [Mucilaginibacter sp. UR6-11]
MNLKIFYGHCALVLLLAAGCAQRRDLVYFSNMANATSVANPTNQEVYIAPNDLINVTMHSLNPESDNLFLNKNATSIAMYSPMKIDGYKVNENGMIHLPIVGDIKVAGMKIEEAQKVITAELSKKVKEPLVEVHIVNFKITVIGEVSRPSTFNITDEKIDVLEALGMAGDMTVYGKRENVLVIRNEDGKKTLTRLNLNDKASFNSPYFYLKQNDIVYVEPDKSKAVEFSQNTRLMPIVIASISALAVLAAVVLKR